MPETAAERSERARRAAYIRWSNEAPSARSAAARLAAQARYARRVDPDHLLPADERAALIAAARKAEMSDRRLAKLRKRREGGA